MEEQTINGDLPPAYCSLFRPGNCSDTIRTSDVIVSNLDAEPLVAPSFENKYTRIVFIQKVLAIRCLQVAAASLIIAPVYRFGDLDYRLRSNTFYYCILSWSLVHAATVFPLLYWKDTEKKTPYNFIILVTNTISTAFILVVITTGFLKIGDEFLIAWIFYTVLTLALLLYTVFILDTSQEFRFRDANLLTGGLSILMIAISAITAAFIERNGGPWDIFPIIYLTLLCFVVCAYAVYRLQVITSGEYHRPLTPTDFVTAALYSQIDLVRDIANWPVYLMKNISVSE